MTVPDAGQVAIPGLEPPRPRAGALETAVRRTLEALNAEGLIEERHAARLQLAIEMAQVITLKRETGRVSTVANDGRVLMELLDKILPAGEGTDAMLRRAMELWSDELEGGGDRAGDTSTATGAA